MTFRLRRPGVTIRGHDRDRGARGGDCPAVVEYPLDRTDRAAPIVQGHRARVGVWRARLSPAHAPQRAPVPRSDLQGVHDRQRRVLFGRRGAGAEVSLVTRVQLAALTVVVLGLVSPAAGVEGGGDA